MGKLLALYVLAVVAVTGACGGGGGKTPDTSVDTTIDDGPPALTKDATVSFTFHSSPVGADFQCAVDGGAPVACTSPFMATVGDGMHAIAIAALDAKGNPDATPATRQWRVDLMAPDTTITTQPPALDNNASPMFAFTGSDPSGVGSITFECALDAAAFAACTSPTTVPVADGSHTYAVRAVDAAGNPDPSPASVTWVVDTSRPDTQITAGPADASTSGPTPQFAFTSSLGTATFECQLDTGAFAPCTSPFTLPAQTDGQHVFTVRAKDSHGVVDPSPPSRTWTVDAVPPDVQITLTPVNPSNVAMPMFAFVSSDATATFECQVNGSAFAACTSPFTTPILADGTNTFHVRSIDPVGNVSTTTPGYTWIVDTVPPTVTITTPPPSPSNDTTPTTAFSTTGAPATIVCQVDATAPVACASPFTTGVLAEGTHTITIVVADAAGNSAMAMATAVIDITPPTVAITSGPTTPGNNKTPTFTFTAAGATTVQCAMDAGAFAACASPFTAAAVADGAHTFVVKGTDAVGNFATASYAFTVDTVKPTVTITASPADPSNAAAATFAFAIGGGPATTTCQVDATAPVACASPFTTPTLADGAHTVTIVATDTAGNIGSAAKTYTLDTVPPTVTITSQPSSPTNQKTGTVTFTVSGGAISTTCQLDGGAPTACAGTYTTGTLTDGSHTVVVKSTDAAGNFATQMATWTIDTGAPVVTITSSPTNPTGSNVAVVSFTVTGAATSITCQLDAGAFTACTSPYTTGTLADGSHTITVKATDAANNSGTDFRTFTVDTTPPTVTITSQPPANTNINTPTITFTISGGASGTTCSVDGGAPVACANAFTSGVLADGAHAISVTSTDAVGNSQTKTASFTVDTVAPTVTITTTFATPTSNNKPPIAFTTAGSPSTIQCQIDAGAFAACTSPFTPGAALGEGAHTITVKVTDLATNFSTASVMFTVDTIAPTVSFVTVPPNATNNPMATVTFTTAGSPTLVECKVDAGAFGACTSPFTTSSLADGAHSISVRVTDAAGNTSSITTNFTVDTVAPTVTITTTFANPTSNPKPPIAFTTAGAPTIIQCQIDSGAFAACTSPFTPGANLNEGSHTITVKVTDAAGNSSTDAVTFTIDTVAPTVSFVTVPPNATNNPMATVTFTTAGAPTLVECKVDAGAFAACTSPFTTSSLADGAHSITVRVTDAAGNTASVTTNFTVDTVAPTVAITTTFANPTSNSKPPIAFTTAGAPTIIQCQIDSGAFAACTSPFTPGAALADGSHTITVKVTDAAGNSSTDAVTFTVDTMAPTVTITTTFATPTSNNKPPIAFTTAGAPTIIQCQIDAGAFAACTSPFTPGAALSEGSHTITVKVTDAAGNASTDAVTFTVDTIAPTVTITTTFATPTSNNKPPIAFTTGGAPTSIQCQIDAGGFAACTSPFTPGAALSEGSHTITVKVTDAAGNSSTDAVTFTVDTIAPTVTITTTFANPTSNNKPPIAFTTGGAPTLIQCQIDAGAFAACTSPFTPGVALGEGSHTITVKVTDAAGNASTDAVTFTVDTIAPTVTITTTFANPTGNNKPPIAFTTAGSPTIIQCQIDSGAFAACTSPFTPGAALGEGSHTITVKVTDAAGNSSTDAVTFTVDTIAPTVSITTTFANPTNNTKPPIAFTTAGSPSTIQCQIDSGAFAACTSPFTPGTALAEGSHTITVKVTDAAGNSSTDAVTFTVDTTAPVVTVTPVSTPTNNAAPSVAFTVTGSPTTITCKVDAGAPAACTSPFVPSPALADGAHTITVAGTDAAGNTGTDSTTFTVDTAPPTITITSGPDHGWPTGDAVQVFGFTGGAGAATFTCAVDGGMPSACTAPTFTTAALANGPHSIVITAFDAAGNSATATATNELNPIVMCLDGATNHADTDVSGTVETLTAATMELWFRSHDASVRQDLVGFDVPAMGALTTQVEVARWADNTIVVTVDARSNGGALNQRFFTPTSLDITKWHHYAVAFSGTTTRLFIDGVEVTTAVQNTGSQATSFADAFVGLGPIATSLHAGYFARDNTFFVTGGVLDLRISAAALYSATFTPTFPLATPPAASALLQYPLSEGTGTTSSEAHGAPFALTWFDGTAWSAACF